MTFILCNISEMQIELFDIAVDGHCTLWFLLANGNILKQTHW